jgi:hypothetical protein
MSFAFPSSSFALSPRRPERNRDPARHFSERLARRPQRGAKRKSIAMLYAAHSPGTRAAVELFRVAAQVVLAFATKHAIDLVH